MNNPFRMNAKDSDIPPPPPSFFLFNKITLLVAVAAFTVGFYVAKYMYDSTPKPEPKSDLDMFVFFPSESHTNDLLSKPCFDTVVRVLHHNARCADPRQRASLQMSTSTRDRYLVCSCASR